MPFQRLLGGEGYVVETRGRVARRVEHELHEQHAFMNQVGDGDPHARVGQPEKGLHLGVLPLGLLHPPAVAATPAECTGVAAIARLAALLISGQLAKASLLRLLVDLGAAQFARRRKRCIPTLPCRS